MSTNRLEAFSDGVFAIAATLLILNVVEPSGPLGQGLLDIWPSYVAYAVSFVTIGVIWINHHTVIAQIAMVDRLFLLVNIIFLMLIAFIPFPTHLLAEHITKDGAQAAAAPRRPPGHRPVRATPPADPSSGAKPAARHGSIH